MSDAPERDRPPDGAAVADVLVTGATGNLGHAVATELLRTGARVRAGGLDPADVRDRLPTAQAVRLDLTDSSTYAAALTGVRRVFLMRPPAISRVGPTINRFLDAAVDAGVEHVVFASVAGADTNRIVPHHRIERHLRSTTLAWTMLRPGFFAQNLTGAYRQDIRAGHLRVPAADGRVAFIDVRDLGEVAAAILTDPAGHVGRGYHLTGPEAVTFTEVAALLAAELGRPVAYEPLSALGYLRHLGGSSLPFAQRIVQVILHLGLRGGDAEEVDPTLERLLGRPPRSMDAFIADHRAVWEPDVAAAG